jgi:hypothetical protein
MCSCIEKLRSRRGQATVEGAFVIPVIFLLLLLLMQPGIVLYDRLVMQAAAAEGCRMLATRSSVSGASPRAYEEAIRRHLGAIPQQENFHRHRDGCSWRIELEGDEGSEQVTVRITGSLRMLPLLDMGGVLLGLGDGAGNIEVRAEETAATQDGWVAESEFGLSPSEWVGKWE